MRKALSLKSEASKLGKAVWVMLAVSALPVIPYYLYQCWTESDYSHCLLVPLISLYIAYQKSKQRQNTSSDSSSWAWAFLAACLLSYLFGVVAEFAFLARISLIGVIIGLVWTVKGGNSVRFYAFPLSFSLFAIPIPTTLYSSATLPMKLWATRAAGSVLDAVNVPAVIEGNIITLRNGVLEVADACSGLRSLTVLLMIAVLIAYFSRLSWLKSVFLIASSVLIAVILNICRIVCSALMADVFGTQMITGVQHDIVGVLLVLMGLILLLGIGRFLHDPDTSTPKENRNCSQGGAMAHVASNRKQQVVVVLLLLTGIAANCFHSLPTPLERVPNLASFPVVIEDWHGFDTVFPESVYDALSADNNLMRTFARNDHYVTTYIGHYSSAEGGRQRHHPLACYPSAGWNILSVRRLTRNYSKSFAKASRFNQIVVEKNNREEVVRYWNQSGNTILATGLEMNMFRIRARLKRQPYDSCFVTLSTPVVNNDLNAAEQLLDQWTERVIAILPTLPPLKSGNH